MKAIQITFEEKLLASLDVDDEVKRDGRSAVIRRAVADYLRTKRRVAISEAYQRGYGEHAAEEDFDGWAREGVWPKE